MYTQAFSWHILKFAIQGFSPKATALVHFPSTMLDRTLHMHFSLRWELCTLMMMNHSPMVHPMELTFFQLLFMKLDISWGWSIRHTLQPSCTAYIRLMIQIWNSRATIKMELNSFMVGKSVCCRNTVCSFFDQVNTDANQFFFLGMDNDNFLNSLMIHQDTCKKEEIICR